MLVTTLPFHLWTYLCNLRTPSYCDSSLRFMRCKSQEVQVIGGHQNGNLGGLGGYSLHFFKGGGLLKMFDPNSLTPPQKVCVCVCVGGGLFVVRPPPCPSVYKVCRKSLKSAAFKLLFWVWDFQGQVWGFPCKKNAQMGQIRAILSSNGSACVHLNQFVIKKNFKVCYKSMSNSSLCSPE